MAFLFKFDKIPINIINNVQNNSMKIILTEILITPIDNLDEAVYLVLIQCFYF